MTEEQRVAEKWRLAQAELIEELSEAVKDGTLVLDDAVRALKMAEQQQGQRRRKPDGSTANTGVPWNTGNQKK